MLTYRLPGEGWAHRADVPLQDAQRAMRLIRSSATTYGIAPSRIAALGFSAGGHLAATLATDSSRNLAPARGAVDRIDARPDAVGLIYPVIAMVSPFAHPLSTRRLLGDAPTPDAITLHSPASRVTATTPPLFLVHALDDGVVPSDNSLLMMSSMRRAGRPLEVHLYGEGGHGFGLGASSSPVNAWAQSFDVWLQRTFSMALITSIPSRA